MIAPRVALSMLTLVQGGMGGSETYARELIAQLTDTERVDAFALVPPAATGFSGAMPERVVSRLNGGASTLNRISTLASASLRGRAIRRLMADADVVHYPFTVAVPAPTKSRGFVQTLFDVQHLDLPELFSAAELSFRRRYYEGAARRAAAVITISEFARERILHHLSIEPSRVHVAPLGVNAEDFEPFAGQRRPFVLYPARGWAHKNHTRLVQAMELVRAEHPEFTLVLTGGALDTLGELPDWVDRRGLVSVQELRDLYRSAAVMAFPSLYEGFGLPPLEAMASGCPVAAADSGSLPEVVGDAAQMFDARDVGSIAEGILAAIDHGSDLYETGLAQARRFTWRRCADVHLDVYEQVALANRRDHG
jgi:glycosyltransferase involved in cell wall biosynthesis